MQNTDKQLEKFLADAPIFLQPWWLECVAPGSWQYITVRKGDAILAAMPLVVTETIGSRVVFGMPPLTQFLGPWFQPSEGTYRKKLSDEMKLMDQLIDQLPPFVRFEQRFHHSVTNWLPFYWQGFQQTTRYTYVLDDLTDLDATWDGMYGNIRRAIRKAEKHSLQIELCGNVDKFIDILTKTFHRQGMTLPYSPDLVRQIDDACKQRDVRQMTLAVDPSGQVHAAIYTMWNHDTAYLLMAGGDPQLRSQGGQSFATWAAIKSAASKTKSFDFEGSMLQNIETFFRHFGSRQVPYFGVTKRVPGPWQARTEKAVDLVRRGINKASRTLRR